MSGVTGADDPESGTQRRPWAGDEDWWTGEVPHPDAPRDDRPDAGVFRPSAVRPEAEPGDPDERPLSEAELADAWLRELGLNDGPLTGPRPTAPAPLPPPPAASPPAASPPSASPPGPPSTGSRPPAPSTGSPDTPSRPQTPRRAVDPVPTGRTIADQLAQRGADRPTTDTPVPGHTIIRPAASDRNRGAIRAATDSAPLNRIVGRPPTDVPPGGPTGTPAPEPSSRPAPSSRRSGSPLDQPGPSTWTAPGSTTGQQRAADGLLPVPPRRSTPWQTEDAEGRDATATAESREATAAAESSEVAPTPDVVAAPSAAHTSTRPAAEDVPTREAAGQTAARRPATDATTHSTSPAAQATPAAEAPPAEGETSTGPFSLPPKVKSSAPKPPPTSPAVSAPAHLRPTRPPETPPVPQQAAPPETSAPIPTPAQPPVQPGSERSSAGTLAAPPAPAPPPPTTAAPAAPAPAVIPATVPAQRTPPRAPAEEPSTRRPSSRRIGIRLVALLVLALASTFFAWVSAEPFWLAIGHGHTGTATLIPTSSGCRGSFVADDGTFRTSMEVLAGRTDCPDGATVPAHMVSAQGRQIYATDLTGLNLRWTIGFGLVLLCGLAIAGATSLGRLSGWRGTAAAALSVAAPLAVTAVMLALTY